MSWRWYSGKWLALTPWKTRGGSHVMPACNALAFIGVNTSASSIPVLPFFPYADSSPAAVVTISISLPFHKSGPTLPQVSFIRFHHGCDVEPVSWKDKYYPVILARDTPLLITVYLACIETIERFKVTNSHSLYALSRLLKPLVGWR